MELSHVAGSGICSHPQGLKTTISAKNTITVTTRYNLPASSVCCSFLQGQNATKYNYETRESSRKLIDNAAAFSRMSRVRPQTRMIRVAGQQTLFVDCAAVCCIILNVFLF